MAEMARSNLEAMALHRTSGTRASVDVHPTWQRLMQYCAKLGHGEIEKLKIQDGVPVIADVVREKVKFT
jgi:ribosomal protein S12 methylthiotransferase accessory factor YcaO